MFGKNKKEQNDVDKYLSKKQCKAIAREEKDRIDRQKALEEIKYREIKGTQEMLPVYDTYQGVIVTRDGHFCKIMEVKPLNFMYLSPQAQNNIISLFSQMLSATPYNMQLISYARKADVDSMIRAVEDLKKNEMNPACFQMQQEYENLLRYRAAQNGVTRRFFVVLEFKADLQNDGTDINKVVGDLNAAASRCRGYLEDAGNQFIPTCETDEGVCDILYQMICRKESETVAYDVHAREVFLKYEKAVVEQGLGSMPIITAPETIAPNWMDFSHYNYAVIDDKFYTFAYISDTGYEKNVTAGWLNQFINSGEGVDVEIFLDRHTRDEVYSKIGFNVKQKRAKSLDSHDTDSDFHEIQNAIGAGSYLLDGLAAGEDLFYASVLFTITADDLTELERRFHEFEKNAKGSGYKVVRCDFRMQEAFMSSLPTCSLEKQLYKHSKRNVLTSGASSFYPFVSFEMQDPNGIMIGTNTANNSLVIIDVMDRNIHRNSNGAILGTSGSGKTFTSHLFALRFRMRRIQTFILAPVKGERDYGNGCYRVGGQFVSMSPGSPNHINIMDIHAPDLSNIDSLGDDDASNAAQISLLAQKSRTILTFIKLQAPDLTLEEEQLVDGCVYETYGRFGITEDNMSIYKFGTSEYKEMPILEDLYNTMKNVPELRRVCNIFKPLISGSLSSFNNHTNVDLSNLYIVFDFDACDGKNKVMALFIVLDFCWSKIKEDSSKQKAIFIDEAWNLISKSSNEMCADFIKEIFKTIRAYNGAAFVMTQNASDFFTMNGGEYGRAIITNADTKIIMQLPETEIEILRTAVQLTDDECNKIQQLHRGSGLVIAGSSKLFADFTASDFEAEVISGDIKKSKR